MIKLSCIGSDLGAVKTAPAYPGHEFPTYMVGVVVYLSCLALGEDRATSEYSCESNISITDD